MLLLLQITKKKILNIPENSPRRDYINASIFFYYFLCKKYDRDYVECVSMSSSTYILRSTIADCNRRFALVVEKTLTGRVSRGDRRVLKQSSPQISVASRLLSPVPKSHPHTLKTSRAACVRGGAHRASAGPPLTFTPILSPYDWCL